MFRDSSFQFKLLRKFELDSTAYMEFGAGQCDNIYWKLDSYYAEEDEFFVVEGIIKKHFISFDHYGNSDIPKNIGINIINDLTTAIKILEDNIEKGFTYLKLSDYWKKIFVNAKELIIKYLHEIVNAWSTIYKSNDCLFIYGL